MKKTCFGLFVLAAMLLLGLRAHAQEPLTVRIDLSYTWMPHLRQGLVNGPDGYSHPTAATDIADKYLSGLHFGSWRLSGVGHSGYGGDIYGFVVRDCKYDKRFSTHIVVNLHDVFNARYGRPARIKKFCLPLVKRGCFTSFAKLRKAWDKTIGDFLEDAKDKHVDDFDLFSEPDLNAFENVTPDQIYDLMKDEYALVKKIRPGVKIVGPSVAGFKPDVFAQLLERTGADNIHFDALSWHELGDDPRAVMQDVVAMRTLLAQYPQACKPECPEIHINEYEGENRTLVPGNAVGWLQALEQAGVDEANRACWGGDMGSPIHYQSCWHGFSGLLMPDGVTPQPLYWVYWSYAEMTGARFLPAAPPPGVAVISGPVEDGIGILAGNLGDAQDKLGFSLKPFPDAGAKVEVFKIANTDNKPVAMPEMKPEETFDATAQDGALSFTLENVAKGDAYWIKVMPPASGR
ncbi:MAG: hypothetical protein GC185_03435 [Alphaproteobacteria bacterium]|nr:hypothetical protein [Alphaproteobacteria bacterium]